MADEIANLMLEQLRRIREVVESTQNDVSDLKLRMLSSDRHLGEMQVQLAGVNIRLDRFDERLGRVERRLELADA